MRRAQVVNESERTWNEAVVIQLKILSWYLLGVTEETYENSQSGWSAPQSEALPLHSRLTQLRDT
jgi:hypothetical protein